MDLIEKITRDIEKATNLRPALAVVLGSGLGEFAETLTDVTSIDTSSLEGYPSSSIPGHAGRLIFGKLQTPSGGSKKVLVFKGRVHLYESGDLLKTITPVLVAKRLGINRLILTNASGGMNPLFTAGDLMLIRDFINATGENPLIQMMRQHLISNELCHNTLSEFLSQQTIRIALDLCIPLHQGTYCWVEGPSYETASEIRMLRRMGGDAVGMSTVPEILAAGVLGIETVGISCITNMATGLSTSKLSHTEVTETANRVKERFTKMITSMILEFA